MSGNRLAALGVAICVVVGAPRGFAEARAQAPTSVAIEHFEPLPAQGANVLNVGSSSLLPHLRPSVGVLFHYQASPLVVTRTDRDGRVVGRLVEGQLKAELWAALGLFDVAEIGVILPLVPYQFGDDLGVLGQGGDVTGWSVGDLRVVPKIRALDPERFGGFGLSVVAPIHVPTGDTGGFNSDGAVRWEPRLVLDYHLDGGLVVAANVGYLLRPRREVRNLVSDDALRWGLGVRAPLPIEELKILGSLWGSVPIEQNQDPAALGVSVKDIRTTPVEFLLGAQAQLPANVQLHFGAGAGLTRGLGAPSYRVFLTALWADHVRDSDGDGVDDDEDGCPAEPEDADGFQDADGCPDPDNDGDGHVDGDDMCPDEAEDEDGFEEEDGCPEVDNDRDGLADADDKCPDEAEDKDGFADEDGCPDRDNDQDKVPDEVDGCPLEPEDPDGFDDLDGCPDRDNDEDGVPDAVDECPDRPETANGFEDDDGCPDTKVKGLRLTPDRIEIDEKVYFASNRATIKRRSFDLLRRVAALLEEHPEITRLQVQGHTDAKGRDAANLKLSRRRAAAVVDFLVKAGIDRARMTSEGFGETRPVAENRTRKGRAANRRTEFRILAGDDGAEAPVPSDDEPRAAP